jgi:hypothetical protein
MSPIDFWDPQSEYLLDYKRVKTLDIVIPAGKSIYIPAYWWYTFKFEKDTTVAGFRYRTYMNNIAIIPYIIMHVLQLQNTKNKVINSNSKSKI